MTTYLTPSEASQTDDIEESKPSGQADTGNEEQPTKGTSILIVEDESGVRELLKQLLNLEGYQTTSVENGSEGVSEFQKKPHDMVFTDFRMPGMSGAEVAKAIKSLSSKTPVVVVTGWDPDNFADELNNSGVDRIVQKPFDMDEILDLVSDLTKS